MAFTSHGHRILGTTDTGPFEGSVARCGGPGLCAPCSMEATTARRSQWSGEDETGYHTEETLFRVFEALLKADLTREKALDAIREMQNHGILFRERTPDDRNPE